MTLSKTELAFCLIIGSGVCAPIGAFLSVYMPTNQSNRVIPVALAFSAGVLIWVAMIGLHPEAFESLEHGFEHRLGHNRFENDYKSVPRITLMGAIGAGILAGVLIDALIHRMGFDHGHGDHKHGELVSDDPWAETSVKIGRDSTTTPSQRSQGGAGAGAAYETMDDGYGSMKQQPLETATLTKEESKSLLRSGLVTVGAVIAHNFPEGLATYTSTVANEDLGVLVGVAVALHNLPLGVAIATPIYMADPSWESRLKSIAYATVAMLSSVLGGLIGYLLFKDGIKDITSGVIFGLVEGLLLFTAFKELLPQVRYHDPRDRYATWMVFFGFLIMDLSLAVFDEGGGHEH